MKKWTAFKVGIILVASFIITMYIVPPLLGWTVPWYESWPELLDSLKTPSGLIIGIIAQAVPVICVTLGAIYLTIFVVKQIQDTKLN
jgi:hypothetical protein